MFRCLLDVVRVRSELKAEVSHHGLTPDHLYCGIWYTASAMTWLALACPSKIWDVRMTEMIQGPKRCWNDEPSHLPTFTIPISVDFLVHFTSRQWCAESLEVSELLVMRFLPVVGAGAFLSRAARGNNAGTNRFGDQLPSNWAKMLSNQAKNPMKYRTKQNQ